MPTVSATSLPEADTLPALLARQLPLHANDTALVLGGRHYDWLTLDTMARETAAWLAGQGIGHGDRVAVWMVNRVEWLALLFGLAHLGAALVAVNTRYRASELEHILAQSAARMLVLQPGFRKIDFQTVLQEVDPKAKFALEKIAVVDAPAGLASHMLGAPTVAFAPGSPETAPPQRATPDAMAVLFPTSGTTRGPKLVIHSQRTLVLHASEMARAYGLAEAGAGVLGALPLCGALGLNGVLAGFAAGAPVVLMETFDGAEAAGLLREHRLTHAWGSDAMFRQILAHGPEGHDPFPTARQFGFGAFQSGAETFARQASERRVPMVGVYGSSELQAAFSRQPLTLPAAQRIEGGGQPAMAQAEVRIRDAASGALLPAGASGNLEVRAATSFTGYFDDPEASATAFTDDGFFRTGDVARMRGDGSFVFEGRVGDALRLAGFLVNPLDIEEVLRAQPGVADAQAVAVDIDGEPRCVAFVVPHAGTRLSAPDVIHGAARQMAPFKVPARVWLVDSFPTTPGPNGVKVQRSALRAAALRHLAAEA